MKVLLGIVLTVATVIGILLTNLIFVALINASSWITFFAALILVALAFVALGYSWYKFYKLVRK